MTVDVNPLLMGETNRLEIDYTIRPDSIHGIVFDGDTRVFGCITNNAGYMRLKLTAELSYSGECARCLSKLDGDFAINFERTVVTKGTLTEEQLEDDIDEYVVAEKGILDIDEQIKEAIILEFPKKLLCSEDCPGLCPHCGKALKDGPCGCTPKEIDPRLAVLRELLSEDISENEKK